MSAEKLADRKKAQAIAFIKAVITKPWRAGAQGPDAYDCWGLARAAQRELAGRELPVINADPADLRAVVRLMRNHPLHQEWLPADKPRHLDVVTLSHHRHAHHIGVWLALDGGGVLHACEQFNAKGEGLPAAPGVTFDLVESLRATGWARIQFLRHRETV